MKINNKYLIITGALLFIAAASKAGAKKVLFTGLSQGTRLKIQPIYESLILAGFKDPQLQFALAQMLHETGEFTSRSKVGPANNNYSGIMYINKPAVQKNATRGSKFPASEGAYYYAKFNTLKDWAIDFKRVLALKNKPIEAQTLTDYITRLANNKYFDIKPKNAVKNYTAGLNKYYNLLTV